MCVGKDVLDLIASEETKANRPDLTVLIVRKDTRYPGQIDGKLTRKLTLIDKVRARAKLQEVIDVYNPGAFNPF